MRIDIKVILCCLLLLIAVHPAQSVIADPGDTERVSLATDGTQGQDHSSTADISGNGRYIAFASAAGNLVPDDTNGKYDVFVHDRQTGQTQRISVDSSGVQANNDSFSPAISGNGRFISFRSSATNLVDEDQNAYEDVFVHDLQTGETTLVSVSSGGASGNNPSRQSSISKDGRYIAFESAASNLTESPVNGQQIYVRDLVAGVTVLVSTDSSGTPGNGYSNQPSISSDGRYIAFTSTSSNLSADDTNFTFESVFVHDIETGETTLVSVSSSGAGGGGDQTRHPSISANGRFVAFESNATNLIPGDTNNVSDIFLHDRLTGITSCVSVTTGGAAANNQSTTPEISADGRMVIFASTATNLSPVDTGDFLNIFAHDRRTGETVLVSVAAAIRDAGNGPSFNPVVSKGGHFAAYESNATDLVAGDNNGFMDVFVTQLDIPWECFLPLSFNP